MKNNYWIDLQSKDHELLGVMKFFSTTTTTTILLLNMITVIKR